MDLTKDEEDDTEGVWQYLLDRSGSEKRIYFRLTEEWVSNEAYGKALNTYLSENILLSDKDFVDYVHLYCLSYGLLHGTQSVFEGDEFIDVLE